jgi:hypothetical protein
MVWRRTWVVIWAGWRFVVILGAVDAPDQPSGCRRSEGVKSSRCAEAFNALCRRLELEESRKRRRRGEEGSRCKAGGWEEEEEAGSKSDDVPRHCGMLR